MRGVLTGLRWPARARRHRRRRRSLRRRGAARRCTSSCGAPTSSGRRTSSTRSRGTPAGTPPGCCSNRALGSDYPGTLGRPALLPHGHRRLRRRRAVREPRADPDGDRGRRTGSSTRPTLFVRRRPPTVARFLEQRPGRPTTTWRSRSGWRSSSRSGPRSSAVARRRPRRSRSWSPSPRSSSQRSAGSGTAVRGSSTEPRPFRSGLDRRASVPRLGRGRLRFAPGRRALRRAGHPPGGDSASGPPATECCADGSRAERHDLVGAVAERLRGRAAASTDRVHAPPDGTSSPSLVHEADRSLARAMGPSAVTRTTPTSGPSGSRAPLPSGRPAAFPARGLLLGRRAPLARRADGASGARLLPAASGRSGEFAILAARSFDIPFSFKASYWSSFFTLGLLSGMIAPPSGGEPRSVRGPSIPFPDRVACTRAQRICIVALHTDLILDAEPGGRSSGTASRGRWVSRTPRTSRSVPVGESSFRMLDVSELASISLMIERSRVVRTSPIPASATWPPAEGSPVGSRSTSSAVSVRLARIAVEAGSLLLEDLRVAIVRARTSCASWSAPLGACSLLSHVVGLSMRQHRASNDAGARLPTRPFG